MSLSERIQAFTQLGNILANFTSQKPWTGFTSGLSEKEFNDFNEIIAKVKNHNGWFTQENVRYAISSIVSMLKEDNLTAWTNAYTIPETSNKKVAVIMAGNIPLVGFHDFLCVLISGHSIMVKCSSSDNLLLPAVSELLITIAPDFKEKIRFVSQLKGFDAVIATGSNNSALYFESYFQKYPHIIRKNRTSVAVVNGKETPEEIAGLAEDVFRYYGLGCRNVTKVYVPEGYNLDHLFGAFYPWKEIVSNNKYANNYDYNKAVYLMNKIELIENGFLLLKEDTAIHSPLGVLFYEYYSDPKTLEFILKEKQENIQCIVGKNYIPFGQAQQPSLLDYADGVDTMDFLTQL